MELIKIKLMILIIIIKIKLFKDVLLEKEIKATNNLEEALKDIDYLLITIPTQFVKETLIKVKPFIKKKITVINAAKGFDLGTNMRMSDTIRSVLDDSLINPVVSLIGPSHAEEVVIRMLTTVCAVSLDEKWQKMFKCYFLMIILECTV